MTVSPAEPEGAPKIIFAALDADIAREMEPKFAAAGCAVVSNSSAFRMHANVPLVIPEVNADHLHLIEEQPWRKESGGYMVTNPNCSAIGLVMALKPIEERFGIEQIFVTTMQAISGAGYPGVPSMDILGNVIPYIKSEEEKMEAETLKLLGRLDGHAVKPLAARMSAHCNRVAVEDGHTESVSIKLGNKLGRPVDARRHSCRLGGIQAACGAASAHGARAASGVGAAGRPPAAAARSQSRARHGRDGGPPAPLRLLDWKFTVLSHNTIRGAAGAAILNAELLASLGKLEPVAAAAANVLEPKVVSLSGGRQRPCEGRISGSGSTSAVDRDSRKFGMSLVVMKFGGTSVEDPAAIDRTAAIVAGPRGHGQTPGRGGQRHGQGH